MSGVSTVVVEPFVEGMEVSVCVIQTARGPLALLPTQIELHNLDHLLIDADLDLHHHLHRVEVGRACFLSDLVQPSVALSTPLESLLACAGLAQIASMQGLQTRSLIVNSACTVTSTW